MAAAPPSGLVLVCGLGSLGQTCLRRLLAFDVPLSCLDWQPPRWRDAELERRLAPSFVLGDMRQPRDLLAAGVDQARSILLLSSDSTVNLEAALQIRPLNPRATVVVRSSSQRASLGVLLEQRLPGVAVVDPMLLTASVFSQSLRPSREAATIRLGRHRFELRERREGEGVSGGRRLDGSPLQVCLATPGRIRRPPWPQALRNQLQRRAGSLRERLEFWSGSAPLARLAALGRRRIWWWVGLLAALGLVLTGVALFRADRGWLLGLFVTLGLLNGEYVDPASVVLERGSLLQSGTPWTVAQQGRLLALMLVYALAGTVLTSALTALILERLLSVRLGLRRARSFPRDTHAALLVEGGSLAPLIAEQLQADGIGVVCLRAGPSEGDSGPIGSVRGPVADPSGTRPAHRIRRRDVLQLPEAFRLLRRSRVAGVALLSDDLLMNLQLALDLERRWPEARLSLKAKELPAAEVLGDLLGGLSLISSVDLAADALVATAFGETVEEVHRVEGRNLMLVRYRVEAGDTLAGLSIARVQGGYGVTAVALKTRTRSELVALPALERVLRPGQDLLVLADLEGLRRVEIGEQRPPAWRVRLQAPLASEWMFETQQCLARHLGGAPGTMAPFLDGTPQLTPALDQDLAEQLGRELRRRGVQADLVPEPVESADESSASVQPPLRE
ncbi:NAD-binding protein [Synechococcus sp. RSCCF101]|uniref:NAD-binding protein n=1 Tax=Synechococcus sp. RSCCF101 TaxID=2511069 RepID=UPI001780BBD9|nr:NAD-binding protein [Synechococcus sp. RSCCF101]